MGKSETKLRELLRAAKTYLAATPEILGVLELLPANEEARCLRATGLAAAAAMTGVCPCCSIGDIAMGESVEPVTPLACCRWTHGPPMGPPPLLRCVFEGGLSSRLGGESLSFSLFSASSGAPSWSSLSSALRRPAARFRDELRER